MYKLITHDFLKRFSFYYMHGSFFIPTTHGVNFKLLENIGSGTECKERF